MGVDLVNDKGNGAVAMNINQYDPEHSHGTTLGSVPGEMEGTP